MKRYFLKVLFVCSGNNGISPIIRAQAESLNSAGIDVTIYAIKGRGVVGYIKNVKPLRKTIRQDQYDIVHAHYALSAYVASLAGAKPMVVSLMGSDCKSGKLLNAVLKTFIRRLVWKVILKSEEMNSTIKLSNPQVIPNGVNLSVFKPLDKNQCIDKLHWDAKKQHILFAASPKRHEKNFDLAKQSFDLLNDNKIVLHVLDNVPDDEMPLWYNAANIVMLTSFWEGSPNVVKEAMACNCPVVATDVGDIRWLFGNTPGYFIADFSSDDVAKKITEALAFKEKFGNTKGRERLIELGLDAESVARKIIELYQEVAK